VSLKRRTSLIRHVRPVRPDRLTAIPPYRPSRLVPHLPQHVENHPSSLPLHELQIIDPTGHVDPHACGLLKDVEDLHILALLVDRGGLAAA